MSVLAGEQRAWGTMSGSAEKGALISVANSWDALQALAVGGTHDQKFTVWDGKTSTVVPARKAVTLACLEGSENVKTCTNDGEKYWCDRRKVSGETEISGAVLSRTVKISGVSVWQQNKKKEKRFRQLNRALLFFLFLVFFFSFSDALFSLVSVSGKKPVLSPLPLSFHRGLIWGLFQTDFS